AMRRIFAVIEKIAATDINVLVSGASGTGKELIARSIHAHSPRAERVFVPINCGALPEHLVESEIFGHERGAFTGAIRAKTGLLETAHGGTFFLDEIGELPQTLQVKFLRVLQDGKFRRLGSTEEREVDIRLICATNQDLEAMVAEGTFREDLFYRINTFAIDIPPLKERPDDIPLMIEHAVTRYGAGAQQAVERVAPEAMRLLLQHEWQGNVRELEHAVERAVILSSGELIEAQDIQLSTLGKSVRSSSQPSEHVDNREVSLEVIEKEHILSTLSRTSWNKSRAAQILCIERSTLDRKLKRYKISRPGAGEPLDSPSGNSSGEASH
ncbi:MAG: sigma-54 dependent transcriptional regulator, partial [Planctomycetaceae bacterium]